MTIETGAQNANKNLRGLQSNLKRKCACVCWRNNLRNFLKQLFWLLKISADDQRAGKNNPRALFAFHTSGLRIQLRPIINRIILQELQKLVAFVVLKPHINSRDLISIFQRTEQTFTFAVATRKILSRCLNVYFIFNATANNSGSIV